MKCTTMLVALASLTVGGCVMPPSRPAPARAPQTAAANESAPSAAMALLEQARAERAAGRFGDATSAIERALRIAPNEPLLWIELGEIKAEQGDPEQAELMARKALTLAAGDRAIEARASRLID